MLLPFFGTFVAFGGFAAGLGLRTKTIGPLAAATLFTAIPLFIAAMSSPVSLVALLPLELLAPVFGAGSHAILSGPDIFYGHCRDD